MQPSRVDEKMLNRGLSPIVIDWKTKLKAIARIKRQLIGSEDFLEYPLYPKKGTFKPDYQPYHEAFYCYFNGLRWSVPWRMACASLTADDSDP